MELFLSRITIVFDKEKMFWPIGHIWSQTRENLVKFCTLDEHKIRSIDSDK